MEDMRLGRVLDMKNFEIQEEGSYKIVHEGWLSVIEMKENGVEYLLNNIQLRS